MTTEISNKFSNFLIERKAIITNFLKTLPTKISVIPNLQDHFIKLVVASDYILEQVHTHSEIIVELLLSDDFFKNYVLEDYVQRFDSYCQQVTTYFELEAGLRQFRRREIIRLIWRDVLGFADIEAIMYETSLLAESCITVAVKYLQSWLEERFGEPVNSAGDKQLLQIITMGKLGGQELNLSSDIDLILCYPESGNTISSTDSISNQQFFVKLAQQLIQILNKITSDGFVFRVDMRLRPYGESGPLVINFASLRDYFMKSARQWERYAFVKARILYGDKANNERLNKLCQEFVYQTSDDKEIMFVLKNIKIQICQQVLIRSMGDNIKLGEGGIREIEFIVQVFQLVYGEKHIELRNQNLLAVLNLLKAKLFIDPVVAEQLQQAYIFLRLIENRLQAFHDKQEHRLPADSLLQQRLAYILNYQDWNALNQALQETRKVVSKQFAKIMNQSFEEISISKAETIRNINYKRQVAVKDLLTEWKKSSLIANIGNEDLWRTFSESLTMEALKHEHPTDVASRTIKLLATLIEQSPEVLTTLETHIEKLVQVSGSSEWLATELTQYPKLLIELVSLHNIDLPIDLKEMQLLLKKKVLKFEQSQGVEKFLALLNQFKYEYTMRIAVADVLEQIKVMRVSDLLTDLAIAIVREILQWVWHEAIIVYGLPQTTGGKLCELNFIVVAYGKLGGIELSYSSDLDLVFLHNADENALTNGATSITGAQFYQRLGKRFVELLSSATPTGKLYTVDTQLKPMGKAGMLVNNFSTYANYQQSSAWTWEHQALVRARVIAGDEHLAEEFAQLRRSVLMQHRDIKELRTEVIAMRERMRAEKKHDDENFHLKEDLGGITDIEFLAQYVVLAWAQQQPLLLMFPDNIRIFETCESAGLLSRRTVDLLCDAYRTFRTASHRLTLAGKQGIVSKNKFLELRQEIHRIGQFLLQG
ncbi:MAG: hypothetical protein A3E87_07065 [Gammaproteobacteria bacterium RIFCSPHIGHO2_12_FULL_35_23]|nr:MAG: hypothetical protein A3E87_07065 [Gammaproteobacteria bacterium RIFCSPHIGHO2_12_FULL_35_23]